MVPITLLLTSLLASLLGIAASTTARAECPRTGPESEAENHRQLMRVNRRADDFRKIRAEEEAREQIREHGRHRLHESEREHEIKMEHARVEFIRRRKPPKRQEDELEREDDHRRTARNHAMETARACYVREHDRLEAQAHRGRAIPENQEYELDN